MLKYFSYDLYDNSQIEQPCTVGLSVLFFLTAFRIFHNTCVYS